MPHRVEPPGAGSRGRWIRAAFVAAAALPFVFLLLPGPDSDAGLTAVAAALTVVIVVATWVAPWGRLGAWWMLAPAVAYLGVIALLREAGGGNNSGFGPMVMLPVIAMALFGSRKAMFVTVFGVAVVYWAPILLDGSGERYPVSGYRIGLLFLCLSGLLGAAVQSLRDQLRERSDAFARLALQDALTGLPNRRAWEDTARARLADAARRGEPLTVALIDIDHLKQVNDRDGHAAGDELLKRFAESWAKRIRAADVLARLGGDEFALLLPACDLPVAFQALTRLRTLVPEPACSIGVAQWDGDESAAALLERADQLLYEAKRAGRDRIVSQPSTRPASRSS